jgi:hypothetical protein
MTDRRRVHAHAGTATDRVLAELVTGLDALTDAVTALGLRLDHRIDLLERLALKLRDEKLDKTAVADQVLEQLRRVRR